MTETVIQPQSQLLSIKLGDNNYLIWKQQVWAAVNGYGLEGFLTGESTKPEKYTESTSGNNTRVINPAYALWNRQDQLLVSWLLSSLSENVLISTVGLTTAKDIWDGLQTEFATRNTAKVMQFRLQLQTMKKGNTPMKDYLNKIKSCCDILNSAGEEIPERVQILYILGGRGPEYDSVIVSITARAEPCSLREVHAILLSFENRLESYENHGNADNSQFYVNLTTQSQAHSYRRGGFNQATRGRGVTQNPRGGRSQGRTGNYRGRGAGRFGGGRPRCQICHYNNHTADKCFYRIDLNFVPNSNNYNGNNYPGGYTQQTGNNLNPPVHVTSIGNYGNEMQHDMNWYPDSGATNHVTYDLGNLNIASEYQGGDKVQLGNGSGSSHRGSSSQGNT